MGSHMAGEGSHMAGRGPIWPGGSHVAGRGGGVDLGEAEVGEDLRYPIL